MFKMNSWHFVQGQSPQPGEGLELVVESCGPGSESCCVLTLGSEVVGRGQLGESMGPGPRDCAVAAAAPHPSPLGSCGFVLLQRDSLLQLCKYVWNTDITRFHIASQC